jgi:predicted metal-dependent peptidase
MPEPQENSTPIETPVQYNPQEILDELARISTKMMIGDKSQGIENEPFYAHFFTGLVKRVSTEIDTLAVGYHNGLITFYVNAHFWKAHLPTMFFRLGGVKHEILHIVFRHIFRGRQFSHKAIFNIAADIIVNQYIDRRFLIDGAVFSDKFPELNLEPDQHINYYYNALLGLFKQFSDCPDTEEAQNNQSWQALKGFLDENDLNQRKHALWKKIDDLSNAEKDIIEAAIGQTLENTLNRVRDYGSLPAGLQQYLHEFQLSQTPAVNWRRILRLFANSSSKTRLKNTLRCPSKRYGTNPGIKVKKKQKILVALDTSGSISQEELQAFFNEVYHIWKQGAEIQIAECDTEIGKIYKYAGKIPQSVTGGGGTAFEAPLKFANETYHPDAIIYFTDGYGPNPTVHSNCPILWLLSKNGANPDYIQAFQGRKLKMI